MKESLIKGKTAFITGASSGIGKACAELFAANGTHLVITARRLDRLKEMAQELSSQHDVKVTPVQLDVQNYDGVTAVSRQLEKNKIQIDLLINNAGLALSSDKIQDSHIDNWNTMIDTNVKGLLFVTKTILPQMIERNTGHIINIGSIAGHWCYPSGNVYCATKHAVKAISESLRMDLMGTAIRVSEVDPGAVETEFSEVRYSDKEKAKKIYEGYTPLTGADIADAVFYCASRPLHVNVSEIIVFPQAQSSLRDIYRKQG